MLALQKWVNHELIPELLHQGLLLNRLSEYDRRYFPTVKDLRNSESLRRYVTMFDQDSFLNQEREGLKCFLRKYEASKDNGQLY